MLNEDCLDKAAKKILSIHHENVLPFEQNQGRTSRVISNID